MNQVSAAKTDPNNWQMMRDAQRLTRSAPHMSLLEVSAYRPALTLQQLQQSLESLPHRGECAQVAARAAQQRPVLATIELCPPSTRRALAAHGASSSGWAARAARTVNSRVASVNCEDPAAGSWTLRSESTGQDTKDTHNKWRAASNPQCPQAMLWAATTNPDFGLHICAAGNPRCGPELLRCLAADRSEHVRAAVAANPNTEPDLLRNLAVDRSEHVRTTVAANPNTETDVVELLTQSPDSDVSEAALKNPACGAVVLSRAARASDLYQRKAAATNPTSEPRRLMFLAEDSDRGVRCAAVENPNCPPEALTASADLLDPHIRTSAAHNRNCPPQTLAVLAEDPDPLVRRAVLGNASTPLRLIEQIINDPDTSIRSEGQPPELVPWMFRAPTASNPNCPGWLLNQFAYDTGSDSDGICMQAVRHPNCPMSTLAALAENRTYMGVARTATKTFTTIAAQRLAARTSARSALTDVSLGKRDGALR